MGKKVENLHTWASPRGDADPCLSGGLLHGICSVIMPLKIAVDGEEVRGKGVESPPFHAVNS